MQLLNIDTNPKTVKGQKHGYMTAILYLAPYKASGKNVCPMAHIAKCWEPCLNTAGHGGIAKRGSVIATDAGDLPDNVVQRARIARTQFYHDDRAAFMTQLVREIEAFIRKARRKGLVPVVRLNGTSDIQWETGHAVRRLSAGAAKMKPSAAASALLAERYPSIFAAFPDVQFYDYTKIAKRFRRELPSNYHLTLSYSAASTDYAKQCLAAHADGAALAVVARDNATKTAHAVTSQASGEVVDGDAHDLRFLDPRGALVVLKAIGRARQDGGGFVVG